MNSRPPGTIEQLPDPWSRYISSRRLHVASQEAVPTPTMDVSANTMIAFLESSESNKKDGNTLEYHPLSPDRPPVYIKLYKS